MKDNITENVIRDADENLIAGAQNGDQLNELNENVASNGGNEEQIGATPSVGDEEGSVQDSNRDPSGSDLGGITNLSLDQLKERRDNNS